MKFVAGVDIGGTRVKCLTVDEDFNHLHFSEVETPVGLPPAEAIALIESNVVDVSERSGGKPEAVCFAVPGIVTPDTGWVVECPNLPGWREFDFLEYLTRFGDVPVAVENDANAGAFGEHFCGAARGKDSFVYIALGTGVGGGLFLNGRLYRGVFGRAGEVGHIPLSERELECGCGGTGHLESFAGALGIVRDARRIMGNDFSGDAGALFEMAEKGDERAVEMFARAGAYLGKGIAAVVNVVDVDLIVLAGGVAGALRYMEKSLYRELTKHTFGISSERVRVVPGLNGAKAGVVGACALALSKYRDSRKEGKDGD